MITGTLAIIINSILMIIDSALIIFALVNIDLIRFNYLDKTLMGVIALASLGWVIALGVIIFNVNLGW